MDDEIEELKDLVKRDLEITADTNKVVHQMRRSARWAMVVRVIYWVVIISVLGASYYLYVAPYVNDFLKAYQNVQSSETNANTFFDNLGKAFSSFSSSSPGK